MTDKPTHVPKFYRIKKSDGTFATFEEARLAVNAHEELFRLCKSLAEKVEECFDCEGTGKEGPELEDACGRCGGQGRVLDNVTGLISELEDALAKAEGK